MSTPDTALDQRYSGPGAVATGWEQTRRALEAAELFWISTVRADGRPHVTPLRRARTDIGHFLSLGQHKMTDVPSFGWNRCGELG
jgi:pyridoxamine 5'-phosphate oxidase-like protein